MDITQSLHYEVVKERILSMSQEELDKIFHAVAEGRSLFPVVTGFEDKEADAVESVGRSLYTSKQYPQALACFTLLMVLCPSRFSVWRSGGACLYMMRKYKEAIPVLRMAYDQRQNDMAVNVLLGECLCICAQPEEGEPLLRAAAASAVSSEDDGYYTDRAQKILQARDRSAQIASEAAVAQAVEKVQEKLAGGDAPPSTSFDPSRPITVQEIMANPFLAQGIEVLKTLVVKGFVRLGDIGGMTQKEYDGAYACACQFVHASRFLDALKLACILMVIDGRNARYSQLAGICMQRLKHYDVADQLYGVSMQLNPKDPMTLVYRGEVLLMMGASDQGVEMLKQGLEYAQKKPEKHADLIRRAEVLLKPFGVV